MESLDIQATKSSPLVVFDPAAGVLRIEGQSYPENPVRFYEPVLAVLEGWFSGSAAGPLTVNINLSYMNTSSSKCLMNLLDRLDVASRAGSAVTINWYYDIDNEMAHESAEEFREGLLVPFNVIAVSG